MINGGQVGGGARPRRTESISGNSASKLDSLLGCFGISSDTPPDQADWERLVREFERCANEAQDLEATSTDPRRDPSSFENLFHTSPVPMMEQDYSEIEEWMEDLRSEGVSHIREVVRTVEDLMEVVPKIRIVAANPAAVDAVGLRHNRLIGPVDPIIVNEGAEVGWLAQLDAVWERKAVARSTFKAATPEGETYDAESILTAPIVDGEPDFSRAVFSLIDVTSHKERERRMAELVEAKNRFLASVSHELRTPLTAILGFSRLLGEDPSLTSDDRRLMLSSVAVHAQEMSDLIEDLLVAARSDLRQLDIVEMKVDLVAEIYQTVSAGGSFTTDVEVRTETSEPYALADPSRVRQILRNLLTNAERYGGDEVCVTVSGSDSEVQVEVEDNGEGLPREDWERIFEPYESAHVDRGRPGAVGIGLAISRQLAELMGGTLKYRFENGRSLFRLQLRPAGH